jgi:hypothetical protein
MITDILYETGLPPRIEDVKIYFNQKGMPDQEAEAFFLHYEKRLWINRNGSYYKDWKKIARREIAAILRAQPWLFNRTVN